MSKKEKQKEKQKEKDQFRKVRKDLIDIPEWLPRKPENDKEDTDAMEGLSENIKSTGLLNPVTIREKNNGRFELIAGSRRLKASDSDEVWAKVEDRNIDEFDMRMKCASENAQRLDLPFLERDKFFYETYELGKKNGKIKSIEGFAKTLGISDRTLSKYLSAGRERCIKKNDITITLSDAEALYNTKLLADVPKVRNAILKMNIDDVIDNKRLQTISRDIDNCIEKGISEKMIIQVIDMAKETHEVVDMTSDTNVSNDSNTKTMTYDFDENKLKDLTTTIIECQPDVRNYIVDKKISTEMAMEINKYPEDIRKSVALSQISVREAEEISTFETVEERKQLIQERMKINNWTEKTSGAIEGEWNKNISIRKQQVADIKTNGNTALKTDFDIQHQRKLDIETDKSMYYDENTRKRYGKIYSDLATAMAVQSPTKIMKKEIKTDTIKLILETYKLCRLALQDLGVIRNASNSDLDFIDADFTTKENSNSRSDK
jgi:ParB/RepB/Spo0J family partition protein